MTQKREHMAMVTTETDVASLRKQLAGTAPGQSEQLQQQRVEAEDLSWPLVGATVFVKIALATLSTQHFHSRWAARKIFYMFQLGLMSSARYWFTDTCCLMAVFSPIFTTTTTSLSLRCCPRTLPAPRAHAYP